MDTATPNNWKSWKDWMILLHFCEIVICFSVPQAAEDVATLDLGKNIKNILIPDLLLHLYKYVYRSMTNKQGMWASLSFIQAMTYKLKANNKSRAKLKDLEIH